MCSFIKLFGWYKTGCLHACLNINFLFQFDRRSKKSFPVLIFFCKISIVSTFKRTNQLASNSSCIQIYEIA